MSDLNNEVLKVLQEIKANQELLLAQGGAKHEFIQPKAETSKAKKAKNAGPIANVVITGHPTRKTWTKKMKSENNIAYKAGLEAGDDYFTRLRAGLEAAKKVA